MISCTRDYADISEGASRTALTEYEGTEKKEPKTEAVVSEPDTTRAETDPVPPDNDYYVNDYFEIERNDIIAWLKSHENDDYYLGTPYGDEKYEFNTNSCMRPNGRFRDNDPHMTCTGFVLDVLMQSSGGRAEEVHELAVNIMNQCEWNCWVNDLPYFINEMNAYYWGAFFERYEDGLIKTEKFGTISEMLSSHTLKKGDLIYFMPDRTEYGYDSNGDPYDEFGNIIDCHIGFYWGDDYSGEDLFWHSASDGLIGYPMNLTKGAFNQISRIFPPSVYDYVLVIPLG